MTTVLVTGAAGFIGSFLCEGLLANDMHVVGIDNLFRGNLANLAAIANDPRFYFIEQDLTKDNSVAVLEDIIKTRRVDVIYHLAAINGTQYFYDRPQFVFEQNTKMTQYVVDAAAIAGVQFIIYASSSEVYGSPLQVPTKESAMIQLDIEADRDSYAASKVYGEFLFKLFTRKKQIPCAIARIFNTYGPRMVSSKYGQVIPEFIARILQNDTFTLLGNGEHTRSFCYIDDMVAYLLRLLKTKFQGVVNLGNDEEISILQLAKQLHKLLDKTFSPVFLPARSNDHLRRCPDLSKLKALMLDDYQTISLEGGLSQTISFYNDKIS